MIETKLSDADKGIISYFIGQDNKPDIPAHIAKALDQSKQNIGDRCNKLVDQGILKREMGKYSGRGPKLTEYYSLISSIEVLESIVKQLEDKDIAQMMGTSYYNKLLTPIMDFFKDGLQIKGFNHLRPDDKVIAEECLKVSPSCLRFVLNTEEYKPAEDRLKKLGFRLSNPEDEKTILQGFRFKGSETMEISVEILLVKALADFIGGLTPYGATIDMAKLIYSCCNLFLEILPPEIREIAQGMGFELLEKSRR